MENIIISNEKELKEKIKKISDGGKNKLHVITDFDRTLTKAFVDGQKSATVIAQIRNGKWLTPDYASKAHALYDKYRPIEISSKINDKEKSEKMHEWWKTHFELLIKCGLDKKVMQEIVKKKTIEFREGSLEFIDLLHKANIPLIIMSAGPGDMIAEYLKQEGRLYDDVYIIANRYEFDNKGKAISVREPIIHSFNKHETEIKGLLIYNDLLKRKNVLLLGDSMGDVGMIEGFPYETLIKIGFLNYKEDDLTEYKKNFDVVILNDGDMDYVNGLLKKLI